MKQVFAAAALMAVGTNAILGVDVASFLDKTDWECLMHEDHSYGAVGWAGVRAYTSQGYVDNNAPHTIQHARAAGMKHIGAYIFPCVPCGDPSGQVNGTVYYLTHHKAEPDMYWYDIERMHWSNDIFHNRAFIANMIKEGKRLGIKAGIYTNYYNWDEIVGLDWSYPADQGLPLWYAHYDYYKDF